MWLRDSDRCTKPLLFESLVVDCARVLRAVLLCAAVDFVTVQVYLVGDPVQLPATVISGRALEQGYDVSLFKRLQVTSGIYAGQ